MVVVLSRPEVVAPVPGLLVLAELGVTALVELVVVASADDTAVVELLEECEAPPQAATNRKRGG